MANHATGPLPEVAGASETLDATLLQSSRRAIHPLIYAADPDALVGGARGSGEILLLLVASQIEQE
jgi:hypothetical protein